MRHSTETALISVFDSMLSELDKPDTAVLLALLDMSAAFDTVNHPILLRRLKNTFGIRGSALQWFSSYLRNRTVSVSIGDSTSEPLVLECSLPQGSKMGPRSYSDYTQPLGCLMRIIYIMYHFYADDSQLYKSMSLKSVQSQTEFMLHMSQCIQKVEKWTYDNKLKLNPSKTEFMILCNRKIRHKLAVSELVVQEGTISDSPNAKNFGVWIDNILSMEKHISELCKSCLFNLNWIRNIRPSLIVAMTKTLVQTLVISKLDYCNA